MRYITLNLKFHTPKLEFIYESKIKTFSGMWNKVYHSQMLSEKITTGGTEVKWKINMRKTEHNK